MKDSFNSVLMPLNTSSKLSGASNSAAKFATGAIELLQVTTSSNDGESASRLNLAVNSDHARFNEMFQGQLQAPAVQQLAESGQQQLSEGVAAQELSELALAVKNELRSSDSEEQSKLLKLVDELATLAATEMAQSSEIVTNQEGEAATAIQAEIIELESSELASAVDTGSIEQPDDLVNKLEQLIRPLADSEQLATELAAIKQAVQEQANSSEQLLEQEIERRIEQPIVQLISQHSAGDYAIDIKAVIDHDSQDAESAITKEIEALIAQLPPSEQQQLLATMKAAEAQKLAEITPAPATDNLNLLRRVSATPIASVASNANSAIAPDAVVDEGQISAGPSLSGLPSAALVSNQVNVDRQSVSPNNHSTKLDKADKEKPGTGAIDADKGSASVKDIANAIESTTKSSKADGLSQLLKHTDLGNGKTAVSGIGASVDSEFLTTQASGVDKNLDARGVAKEAINQATKAQQEALLAKLPLAQDTPAAKMLKERLTLMATANIQQAVIQLDPEELGGMNIRLQLQHDQMSVQFQVQNAQAKELLENAMVKLREMLDQQGIVLKDSDVKHNKQGGQQQLAQQSQQSERPDEELPTDQEAIVLTLHKQSSDGIDYYA